MSKYLVILEKGPTGYGAFSPDVPGCFAVGTTAEETLQRFQEALQDHLQVLKRDGEQIPQPTSEATTVEVLVPV